MRFKTIVAALAILGLGACSSASTLTPVASVGAVSASDAAQAAALISAYRTSRGLPPVTVDRSLNAAAEHQAKATAAAGALAHGDFAGRMKAYGIRGTAAENLHAGSGTVAEAFANWQASPPHNANLLLPEGRRIGLARADSPTRYGRYWAMVIAQ